MHEAWQGLHCFYAEVQHSKPPVTRRYVAVKNSPILRRSYEEDRRQQSSPPMLGEKE